MNKYVRAILIGVVVGIVVCVLAEMALPESGAGYFLGFGLAVFTAYILSNLAGNKKVAAASDAERQLALSMTPPPGRTLLIPYREGYVAKLAGLDLAVDGQPFVQLTAPKFSCISLAPGRHTLSGAFGGFAGAQSKAANYEFEAPEGSVLVVRIHAQMGLVQGAVKFTLETDLTAARRKLEGFPMAAANQPAAGGVTPR